MTKPQESKTIEVLDALQFFESRIEKQLLGHSAITESGSKEKIEKVIDILAEVYQAVGSLED